MASVEVPLNMCARFVYQNYGVSDENMCGKCCKMKDHLELLINQLKFSQLIIKILQEEIKLASTGLKNQDNLTNDESHPNSEKNNAWKVIRRTRAPALKHKTYNHTDQMTTGTFPPVSNHCDPVCNDSVGDDTPISTQKPTIVTSQHEGKNKTVHKKRVSKDEQHKKQDKGLQRHSEKQLSSGYETFIRISNKCESHQRNFNECTAQT